MINLQSLYFFDVSAVFVMLVLAYLSKRLGQALKIRAYYKVLYITAIAILFALTIDISAGTWTFKYSFTVSLILRFVASAAAFLVCLRYWNWLFAEYFKN